MIYVNMVVSENTVWGLPEKCSIMRPFAYFGRRIFSEFIGGSVLLLGKRCRREAVIF